MKLTRFDKAKYYILQFTWGIIMNIFGTIAALAMLTTGHKPTRHGGSILFVVGKNNWGGLNLGMFSFVSPYAPERTKNHEFGHALQNCKWGPLFPFKVAIPSFLRYWKFMLNIKRGIKNTESYYDAWFEKQANELGAEYIEKW